MGEWKVAGREFRTQGDYEAAKRDAAYIEQIKGRYRLDQKDGLESLLNDLKNGKYRFRTILGQDFEEEIREQYRHWEQSQRTGNHRKGRKKAAAGSSKTVRLEDYDKKMQKIIRAEMKKQERRRRILLVCCMGVALLCFGYLGWYYYSAGQNDADYGALAQMKEKDPPKQEIESGIQINYDKETESAVPEILDEYKNLYNLNKRLIGWIKIDDTNIDYPVLQTVDNEYYLKHNFNQEYDKNGSIFLDKDCDVLDRSTNLILYGHHMSSGKMFGTLDKYSSKSYYEKHKYIEFDTIYEKGRYEVMYVFRSKIYEEDEIVFKYYQFIDVNSEAEFDSNMREMAEMSLYDTGVTAKYGDELLTLSTCDYYTDYGRFVVVAKRIE